MQIYGRKGSNDLRYPKGRKDETTLSSNDSKMKLYKDGGDGYPTENKKLPIATSSLPLIGNSR